MHKLVSIMLSMMFLLVVVHNLSVLITINVLVNLPSDVSLCAYDILYTIVLRNGLINVNLVSYLSLSSRCYSVMISCLVKTM